MSLSVACSKKTQTQSAKDPRFYSQVVDETPPKWLSLFDTKRSGFTGRYTQLKPGLTRLKAKAIQPELTRPRPWSPPDIKGVTIRARYQAGADWIRSIEVVLPTDAMSHFRRIWGPSREGQINGRKVAFFWFDEERSIQAVFENRGDKSKLSFWPYVELEHVLDKPESGHPEALARLIGQKRPKVGGRIKRIMARKSQSGLLIAFNPLKFSTRLLTCRLALVSEHVDKIEFKLETLGNPSLVKRVESILTRRWGAPSSRTPERTTWATSGVSITMDVKKPPPMRPPAPTLHFTLAKKEASTAEVPEVQSP